MGKSKYAPALFEVIEGRHQRKRGPRKLALPNWWRTSEADRSIEAEESGESGEADESVEAAGPAEVEDARATPEVPEAMGPDEAHPVSPTEPVREEALPGPAAGADGPVLDVPDHPRWLRVRSGRVEISLNPVNAAVVAGGVLLALLLSYEIGYNFGAPAPASREPIPAGDKGDSVKDALSRPPKPGALEVGSATWTGDGSARGGKGQPGRSAEQQGGARPPTPAGATGQAARLNYVVLQIFSRDHKQAAQYAQQIIESRYGIATALEPRDDKWQLVSAGRFDFGREDQKRQAYSYRDKIKSLGEELAKELASKGLPVYRFSDPYVELEK